MKQILQSYRSGELWLAEVPAPQIDANSVLVRTSHSVVSAGTEKMIIEIAKKSLLGKARARPDLVKKVISKIKSEGLSATLQKTFAKLDTPIAMGYSCAGTVVECGRNVHELKPGDRVACGGAGYATHAEFNRVPRNLCVRVPQGVELEDAAFGTIAAIAMQGVRQADVRLGENVAVIGLGLLGLITVQQLLASGCRVLAVDPNPARCQLATELGATAATAGSGIDEAEHLSHGRGLDAVVLTASTSSNAPIENTAAMLRMRGRAVIVGVVGMNIPRDDFYKKELELRLSMSYGPGRYDPGYEENGQDYPFAYVRWTEKRNIECCLDLMASGALTPQRIITNRYTVDDALEAYSLLEDASSNHLGITLSYPAQSSITRKLDIRGSTAAGIHGEVIGLGIIGAGNYVKGALLPHLKNRPDVRLTGICTATGMSAEASAKKHAATFATTDVEAVLRDAQTDAVLIGTRHDSHADLTLRALKAGKHTLVEKPLCIHRHELEVIREYLGTTDPSRPTLAVGFNRRFSPHTQAIRAWLSRRSSPVTILYRINAGAVPLGSWIQDPDIGGGRIIGEGCHFIDWCRFIADSPIRNIQAQATTPVATASGDDDVLISLGFEDGSIASILYVSDGSAKLPKERIEVHCGGQSALLDDFRETTFHCHAAKPVAGRQNKGADAMLDAFAHGLRAGIPIIPPGELLEVADATLVTVERLRSASPTASEPR